MFEIRCLVGDKKLSDALRALAGQTLEPPVVLPVDATPASAGRPPKKSNRPKAIEVASKLLAQSGDKLSANDLRMALVNAGFSNTAYSYALKQLKQKKALKATGRLGEYKITHHQSGGAPNGK